MNAPAAATHQLESDLEIAKELFETIAERTSDVQGVSRPAYSKIETETLAFLKSFAEAAGLAVWEDAGCNANFALQADKMADRFVVVGSHVDSVPFGGNFDGLAGVVAGLLCLLRAKRDRVQFRKPVHVLALRGEESAWFGPCYIGSKALTGSLTPSELAARHSGDDRELAEHMIDTGIDMDKVRAGLPLVDLSRIEAYLELHIEQGPLLIGRDLPVATVSGIRGNIRHRQVVCIGEAGHSGAVPRAYRKDPVLAMADLFVRLDESWQTILNKGDDLVLTSGIVSTDPEKHAISRIPDSVSFSLDIRSQSAKTLDEMHQLLAAEMRQVEKDRGVKFKLDTEMRVEPARCDQEMVSGLLSAMDRAGEEPFVMPSGGGHDAAVFASAGVPSAMIFVRNANGSHNPQEAMDLSDFIAATNVMYEYLMRDS
ncbi:Zn-dependent hydrolase [Roseibium marinum]|uniref:N-carbamoyl-L-amino-acid hydrolase n=1 Tax=Roseibium marinum TaxID=281252 RepID=A0A2S3UY93_9HYPH|nr:Zn-dependent hydrolase [Roseibium marinum]POF32695.1 N-carbamoyl-L-amino-acid hydrolase [Roseibium marinum]